MVTIEKRDAQTRTQELATRLICRTHGRGVQGRTYRLELNLEDFFIASRLHTVQISWLPAPPTPDFEEFFYVCELPNSKLLVITASQMIAALISRDVVLMAYFLRPTGLETLGLPLNTKEGWTFRIFPRLGLRFTSPLPSMHDRLLWFSTFPGAALSWRSLYANLAAGRLRMEMPPARVLMTVRASTFGDFLLTQSCRILTVSPREEPYDFAKSIAGRIFSINAGSRPPPKGPSFRMVQGAAGWGLSDEEWALLRPVFGGVGARTKLRKNFSALLEKEGTGEPWSSYEARIQRITCYKLKTRLIAEGKWNGIVRRLYRHRMGGQAR